MTQPMTAKESAACIAADWRANRGNVKAHCVLLPFRIAGYFAVRRRSAPLVWLIGLPMMAFYRVGVEWLLGVELPAKTSVGAGLRLYHGQGLVVHDGSIIGRNVVLRQNTSIGVRGEGETAAPVLGDGVDVGANVAIIGPVLVGAGVTIGAGSVVVDNVPAGAVAVGNPARVVSDAGELGVCT